MIARAFRPVGCVAAVAVAALVCYLLSLQVAAERAELASLERRILATQQNIRALQTELGTRGRLSQLEHWNAEVLALSAPTAQQFLEDKLLLARFDMRPAAPLEGARVQLASAEPSVPAPAARQAPAAPMREAVASLPEPEQVSPPVRRASLLLGVEAAPEEAPAPPAAAPLLGEGTLREIRAAARVEDGGGGGD